jgi:hypothetical protein
MIYRSKDQNNKNANISTGEGRQALETLPSLGNFQIPRLGMVVLGQRRAWGRGYFLGDSWINSQKSLNRSHRVCSKC